MNVPELKQLAEEVRWQAQPVRNRYRYGTDMAPIWLRYGTRVYAVIS